MSTNEMEVEEALTRLSDTLTALSVSNPHATCIQIAGALQQGSIKLKGELSDIVTKACDTVVGVLDRSLAEAVGLFHRTANIVVLSPSGMVILQQRAPFKSTFPCLWTIFGGHVKATELYREAAAKEVVEEMRIYGALTPEQRADLERQLRPRLVLIGDDYVYDLASDPNKERRALYALVLTEDEDAKLKRRASELETFRSANPNGLKAAFKEQDDKEKGCWEVMALEWLSLDDLLVERCEGKREFTPDLFDYFFVEAPRRFSVLNSLRELIRHPTLR